MPICPSLPECAGFLYYSLLWQAPIMQCQGNMAVLLGVFTRLIHKFNSTSLKQVSERSNSSRNRLTSTHHAFRASISLWEHTLPSWSHTISPVALGSSPLVYIPITVAIFILCPGATVSSSNIFRRTEIRLLASYVWGLRIMELGSGFILLVAFYGQRIKEE